MRLPGIRLVEQTALKFCRIQKKTSDSNSRTLFLEAPTKNGTYKTFTLQIVFVDKSFK